MKAPAAHRLLAGFALRPGEVGPDAFGRAPGCGSGHPARWREGSSAAGGPAVTDGSAVASGGSAPIAVQIVRWWASSVLPHPTLLANT